MTRVVYRYQPRLFSKHLDLGQHDPRGDTGLNHCEASCRDDNGDGSPPAAPRAAGTSASAAPTAALPSPCSAPRRGKSASLRRIPAAKQAIARLFPTEPDLKIAPGRTDAVILEPPWPLVFGATTLGEDLL
jgi:hypothetical protein